MAPHTSWCVPDDKANGKRYYHCQISNTEFHFLIDDLRIFERVAARESFAAAARELDLSPAMVTRSVARLETRLGVRLMTRTTRLTRLTQDGQTFYQRCAAILADIEQAEEEMRSRGATPTGILRISAPISFGRRHLAPLVQAFQKDHPALSVQLLLTDSSDDLKLRECDLAIRIGPSEQGDFITRRLLQARRAICASPAYLKRFGTPEHPSDLAQHKGLILIRDDRPIDHWMFELDGAMQTIRMPTTLASNSGEVIHGWALKGAGIACKSLWDVEDDLAKGQLIEVLKEFGQDTADMFLIYPDRKNLPNRVRLFITCLTEALGAYDGRLMRR